MAFYRKKPVTIEARQWSGAGGTAEAQGLARWCGGNYHLHEPFGRQGVPCIEVSTLEGVMVAHLGDWVIKGVKGEFYPCKPDVFEATYEPVETP